MADEIREYLRAAQAAEQQGDKGQAVESLKRAATLYREAGKPARALQMLRHAQRVDGTRQDVLRELARFGGLDEAPAPPCAPSEAAAGLLVPDKFLVERGPVRAEPGVPAWCSFCCRPAQEVGPLVAGPAGAFICGACVGEARALLSPEEASPPARQPFAPRPAAPPPGLAFGGAVALASASVTPVPLAAVAFTGQDEAARALEVAMRLKARLVLVVGPEGCGKTTCLRDLERRGLGFYACEASAAAQAPRGLRLLIDAGGSSECQPREAELAWLLELVGGNPSRQVVLAVRGQLPAPAFSLEGGGAELPMFSTRELVAATAGRLTAALASLIQVTVPFRELTLAELIEIARRLAERRAGTLDVSNELLAAMAELAARSGRGGRELESAIARLPAGSWDLHLPRPRKRHPPKER